MIGQIDIEKTLKLQPNKECLFVSVATVLNHVVDAVNALVESNNIHEKQIDELQMKLEPHKCEPNAQDMYDNAVLDALKDKQVDVVVETADNSEKANCQENVRLPYMQNKRLRKALGIAQSALVKLANDAYDMDEHIYIDKILNQIERITKGGNNE